MTNFQTLISAGAYFLLAAIFGLEAFLYMRKSGRDFYADPPAFAKVLITLFCFGMAAIILIKGKFLP